MTTAGASENPPGSPQAGQQFVRQTVTALEMSSYWSTSAFMWTYDNWGGWYDHVKPPKGWGFRVPALLVSAYARHGHVDHTTMDYTAILKFIEENWHLAALSSRDAQSPGLASAFDSLRAAAAGRTAGRQAHRDGSAECEDRRGLQRRTQANCCWSSP